jgi:HEAT repeat protein
LRGQFRDVICHCGQGEEKMMERIKTMLAFLTVICAMGIGLVGYAQPNIPKEKIPSDVPVNVRNKIEGLYSSNPVERAYAAVHLGEMGNRAVPAIPFLIGILDDSKSMVWTSSPIITLGRGSKITSPGKEAAKALKEIGKPAVEPLIGYLKNIKNIEGQGRENAAWALGEIGDSRATEPLIDALNGKRASLRFNAAKALWKIKGTLEFLITVLKDESPGGRSDAAAALGEIKDRRAVKPLIMALKDQHSNVREEAAKALGVIEDGRAVEPLITLLRDEQPGVRSEAALGLGKIKDVRALEPLIAILKDTGQYYVVRSDSAKALGTINDTRAAEALIATLKDGNSCVRWHAAEALGKMNDPAAVEFLIAALKDEDEDVRERTARALGKIGDRRAVEPLLTALKDAHQRVQWGVQWALKKITGKDFGEDHGKWQKWWEQNKGNFLKRR